MTTTAPASTGAHGDVRHPSRPARAAIYVGTVRHRRRSPAPSTFAPRLFLAYLDVGELPDALDGLPLWSARRRAPVCYRHRDYFDGGDEPLGTQVRDLVEARLGRRPGGPVYLLAHLRTFGWLFNPLTVYYCWQPGGRALDAIVLEVTNTPWHERQWYVLDARARRSSGRVAKAMHVSPFLPPDVEYRVSWTAPGERLTLQIEVWRDGHVLFDALLALQRRRLDRRNAIAVLVRYPWSTLRVSLGIYAQAARLFARRVPLYRHQSRKPRRSGS
jgi:DUF1365 family protein